MLTSLTLRTRAPLAEGATFGTVGAYERLECEARGELDPSHPANRAIVNLDKAPRNAHGRVTYRCDVSIFRPVDAGRGNGRLLYEVNNRGRRMLFGNLADGPQGVNDPHTLEELGNAFPLRRGYTLAWSGWDPVAPHGGLGIEVPVATDAGSPIVQTIRDEFVSGTRLGVLERFKLSHEAASLDPLTARLTARELAAGPRLEVPWAFVDARTIELLPCGTLPRPGVIHEFHYLARNPPVLGVGFAATRDVVSWLRHAPEATELLGVALSHTIAVGISQSARYLREHISDGFNGDEAGRRVFDGVLAHIAGAGRLFFNTPFGQPSRTNTQHEDHDFPENRFPFSAASMHDPLTGASGALLRGEPTDPLLMEVNTSTEYWQKGASLLHTDPLGTRDVAPPAQARVYLVAGTQHTGRAGATTDPGPCLHARNPHNPMPALRALLVALEDWVAQGVTPPPSRVPTLAEGTLVAAEASGFPPIPGAVPARATNTFSPPGDWVHPSPPGRLYRTLVCRVDEDGNEVTGIRLPDIAVPLCTYTGWNVYRAPWLAGELADRDGSYFPFAANQAARQVNADPRLAFSERYGDHADYLARVQAVTATLVSERLLLPEDAEHYIERARQMRRESGT